MTEWRILQDNVSTNLEDKTTTTEFSKLAESLVNFERSYKEVHGYLAALICICGATFNLCNIYVLSNRHLKKAPINTLLMSIAVFDLITETAYLPFAIYFHILTDTSYVYRHPIGWICYAIISLNIMVVCHTAAMCLTVALATFRYICVCRHTIAKRLCSKRRAHITIATVIIVSVILCIPQLLCQKVVWIQVNDSLHPWMGSTRFCDAHAQMLAILNFLVCGGVVKTAACVVLLTFTSILLISLKKV